MLRTRWFFFTCLALQVKADPFSELLIDEALNNLNQLVIDLNLDPKVLPTVGTEMITSKTNVIGIDFFHGGSAQLENGELVGLSAFGRTGDTGISVEEDKAVLAALIGIGELSAHYDAIVDLFGMEVTAGITAGISDIQVLLLAEMNLLDPGPLELVDFKIVETWDINVDLSGLEAFGMFELFLGMVKAAMIETVEMILRDVIIITLEDTVKEQFQNVLNLIDVSSLLEQFLSPSGLNLASIIPPEILDLAESLIPDVLGLLQAPIANGE